MSKMELFDDWVRRELENLDATPPEGLNQVMLWNRLQSELQPIPVKKPLMIRKRLWAIVAVFLLLGLWGSYYLMTTSIQRTTVHTTKMIASLKSKKGLENQPVKRQQVRLVSIHKHRKVAYSRQKTAIQSLQVVNEPQSGKIEQSEPIVTIKKEDVIEEPMPMTEVKPTPKLATVRKTLRIIHQNEIGSVEATNTPPNIHPQSLMVTVNIGKNSSENTHTTDEPNPLLKVFKKSKAKQ